LQFAAHARSPLTADLRDDPQPDRPRR